MAKYLLYLIYLQMIYSPLLTFFRLPVIGKLQTTVYILSSALLCTGSLLLENIKPHSGI